jgi:hypothetical protein
MTTPHSHIVFVWAFGCLLLAATPRAAATEPAISTTGQAAPRSAPAHKAALWGEAIQGVQARLTLPGEVEQDALVPIGFEIVNDPDRLPPNTHRLDTFLLETRIAITITGVKTMQSVTVFPPVPVNGIPTMNQGTDFVPLDGSPVKPFQMTIALRPAGEALAPGEYDCVLTYGVEGHQPQWVIQSAPPGEGWWSGKFQTAPVRVKVMAATQKKRTLYLPKTAFLSQSRLNSGFDLRCDKTDVEAVELPVRNGCYLGTRIGRAHGASSLMGGALSLPEGGTLFDDPTSTPDAKDKPGDELTYTVEVFETERAAEHSWMPLEGSDGYKTLWQRTLKVKVPEKAPR